MSKYITAKKARELCGKNVGLIDDIYLYIEKEAKKGLCEMRYACLSSYDKRYIISHLEGSGYSCSIEMDSVKIMTIHICW